jgi:hypothetical protein
MRSKVFLTNNKKVDIVFTVHMSHTFMVSILTTCVWCQLLNLNINDIYAVTQSNVTSFQTIFNATFCLLFYKTVVSNDLSNFYLLKEWCRSKYSYNKLVCTIMEANKICKYWRCIQWCARNIHNALTTNINTIFR